MGLLWTPDCTPAIVRRVATNQIPASAEQSCDIVEDGKTVQ
jgi:hypothetical protein